MSDDSNGKSRTRKASRSQICGSSSLATTSSAEVTTKWPKGAAQPFTWFLKYCRHQLTKSNPDGKVPVANFSTLCSQLWKRLPEEEKDPFRLLCSRDKERYDQEMNNHDEDEEMEEDRVSPRVQVRSIKLETNHVSPPPVKVRLIKLETNHVSPPAGKVKSVKLETNHVPSTAKIKSAKRKRDPTLPKHPAGAFIWFSKENRRLVQAEFPDLKGNEVTRELSRRWGLLDMDEKSRFQAISDNDKERYKLEKKLHQLRKKQDTSSKRPRLHGPEVQVKQTSPEKQSSSSGWSFDDEP